MFALETNLDHSVIFKIASKYCILDSFVDYDGYSISSKGFFPTVVDIMVKKRLAAYLKLKIFLPAIMIPACVSSSPAFHMMYSEYKLMNRVTIYSLVLLFQSGTSQLFPCEFLIVAS